jgi:hypothetical protein
MSNFKKSTLAVLLAFAAGAAVLPSLAHADGGRGGDSSSDGRGSDGHGGGGHDSGGHDSGGHDSDGRGLGGSSDSGSSAGGTGAAGAGGHDAGHDGGHEAGHDATDRGLDSSEAHGNHGSASNDDVGAHTATGNQSPDTPTVSVTSAVSVR